MEAAATLCRDCTAHLLLKATLPDLKQAQKLSSCAIAIPDSDGRSNAITPATELQVKGTLGERQLQKHTRAAQPSCAPCRDAVTNTSCLPRPIRASSPSPGQTTTSPTATRSAKPLIDPLPSATLKSCAIGVDRRSPSIKRVTHQGEPATMEQSDTGEEFSTSLDGWWSTIDDIPQSSIVRIALKLIDPHHELKGRGCFVRWVRRGIFNVAFIVQFLAATDTPENRVVVRVPHYGTQITDDDKVALRSQIMTMRYIKRHTDLPVPHVYGYDTPLENSIGVPYMVMECMEGESISEQWYHAGDQWTAPPTAALEERRHRLLRSVASVMAKFNELPSFPARGMLHFDDDDEDGASPYVGPSVRADDNRDHTENEEEDEDEAARSGYVRYYHRGTEMVPATYDSTQDYQQALSKWYNRARMGPRMGEKRLNLTMGWALLLKVMADCSPRLHSDGRPETFVLSPPDLDWQNILVNDKQEVTGLIDWDRCCTAPRYLGWARTPLSLSREFDELERGGRLGIVGDMPEDLLRYRTCYAK